MEEPLRGPVRRRTVAKAAAALALCAAACGGGAPERSTGPAAAHEGTLTLYTTIAEKDLPTLIQPFETQQQWNGLFTETFVKRQGAK